MKTAKKIAEKYVYGMHGALTDAQEIIYMTSDIEQFADQFKPKWIPVSERLPEIDTSDEWKHKLSHSRTLPVIESGDLNLGWYNHQFGDWQVNGRIGNIRVTEWFDLPAKP